MRVNPEVLSNDMFCLALGQTATHKGHGGHSCQKKTSFKKQLCLGFVLLFFLLYHYGVWSVDLYGV